MTLVACGQTQPSMSGGGTLERGPGGARVLHLSGTFYEMGWWQGHLLKSSVRQLNEIWRGRMVDATVGANPGHASKRGLVGAYNEFNDLVVDQSELWLPHHVSEELRGMSVASGVPVVDLLRLETMRDALRYKGMEARLGGSMAARASGRGVQGRIWWTGDDVDTLKSWCVLIHRHPTKGPETQVVAWPGSVGCLAGIRADGLAVGSAELPTRDSTDSGFGGGLATSIALRCELERASATDDFLARVKGTVGHTVMACRQEADPTWTRLEGMASIALYESTDDVIQFISPRSADGSDVESDLGIALGPYLRQRRLMRQLQREIEQPAPSDDAWFARVALHADGKPAEPFVGVAVTMVSTSAEVSLSIQLSDAKPTRVTMKRGPCELISDDEPSDTRDDDTDDDDPSDDDPLKGNPENNDE